MTVPQVLVLNGVLLGGLLLVLAIEEIRTWVLRTEAKQIRGALAQVIERIRANADRPEDVRMLCEQLLFVAERAGDTDQTQYTLQPVDVAQAAKHAAAAVTQLAKDRKVQLAQHLPKVAVPVMGHPLLIRSALEELLRNAIEVTPAKGRVELTIVQNKSGATVTVADSGPGFSARDRRKFGTLFFVGSAKQGRPGGVGGAAALHFLHVCKAKVDFQSTAKGTLFTVKLAKPTRGA